MLVAYLVGDAAVVPLEVKKFLTRKLPAYMVPAFVFPIAALPLTPNKKIDRKTLAAMPFPFSEDMAVAETAGNEIEGKLLGLWKEVLDLDNISLSANFFSLGGHSIRATQLVNRIYETFDIRLKLRHVFMNPTIHQLAAIISKLDTDKFSNIAKVPVADHYPVAPAQKELWLAGQFEEGRIAYNMTAAFRLQGTLDKQALQQAFGYVINRHESLRTVFPEINGTPVQKIIPVDQFAFRINASKLDALSDTFESDLNDEIVKVTSHAFDLENGPLLAASLIDIGAGEHLFIFAIHHIICDGWSLQIMTEELIYAYNKFVKSTQPDLPELTLQYKDVTHWMERQNEDAGMAEFWQQQLHNYKPKPIFAYDKAPSGTPSFGGSKQTFSFDEATTRAIRALVAQEDTTLFLFLVALVNFVAFKYSDRDDLCIGSPVAGREHPDLDRQIGMYVNTLPMRNQFKATDRFSDLLGGCKRVALSAFERPQFNVGGLSDAFNGDLRADRGKLFDILLVLQKPGVDFDKINGFEGLKMSAYPIPHSFSRLPMTFNFIEKENEIACELEYNVSLYFEDTILLLIEKMKKAVGVILENPGLSIKDHQLELDIEKTIKEETTDIRLNF